VFGTVSVGEISPPQSGLRPDGATARILFPPVRSRQPATDSQSRCVHGKRLVFLTNNFTLPSGVIATLYRYRLQVELLFKWIKQHLRIKAFYCASENAVKTHIWIAIGVYVLVAIVKKRLKIEHGLNNILQILSVTIFQKTTISQVLSHISTESETPKSHNRLILLK
jgi:hypothetical protein